MPRWVANHAKVEDGIREKNPGKIVEGLFENGGEQNGRFAVNKNGKNFLGIYLADIIEKLTDSLEGIRPDISIFLKLFEKTDEGLNLEPEEFARFKRELEQWIDNHLIDRELERDTQLTPE